MIDMILDLRIKTILLKSENRQTPENPMFWFLESVIVGHLVEKFWTMVTFKQNPDAKLLFDTGCPNKFCAVFQQKVSNFKNRGNLFSFYLDNQHKNLAISANFLLHWKPHYPYKLKKKFYKFSQWIYLWETLSQ